MKNKNAKRAFTLVEIMIVLGMVVILVGVSLNSLVQAQRTQRFLNQFEEVYSMVNNARTNAISAMGQPDGGGGFETPAHYGVRLNPVGSTVEIFADLKSTTVEGKYDEGDPILREVDISTDYELNIFEYDGTNQTSVEAASSILFTPLYADMAFDGLRVDQNTPFVIIQLDETSPPNRCRQIRIHFLAGIPEVEACP